MTQKSKKNENDQIQVKLNQIVTDILARNIMRMKMEI